MNLNREQLQETDEGIFSIHMEHGTAEMAKQVTSSVLARKVKLFQAISNAERRLKVVLGFPIVKRANGSPPLLKQVLLAAKQVGYRGDIYGVCPCGRVIERERLEVVPHTKRCSCKVRSG